MHDPAPRIPQDTRLARCICTRGHLDSMLRRMCIRAGDIAHAVNDRSWNAHGTVWNAERDTAASSRVSSLEVRSGCGNVLGYVTCLGRRAPRRLCIAADRTQGGVQYEKW